MLELRRLRASSMGFTLIEIIIVIAIMAIVAGAMAPLAVRTIDSSRQEATLKRQQRIYEAIFGDHASNGTGFLNDIGGIPGRDLSALTVQGNLPSYAAQACGIGMGWRGPYLLEGIDGAGRPVDGWGTPMEFTGWQIHSAGPDRIMGAAADNIRYPATPITINRVYGSVMLEVLGLDTSASPPVYAAAGGNASLCYASNGAMQYKNAISPDGTYTFSSIPQGIQAIRLTGAVKTQPALTQTVSVFCPGGGTVHKTVALR